ncbi:MAG: superoxide dismutase [Bacteroidales bacterium]|nr:superoxide dismutase [Bacteroidales bacterium]
MYKLHDLAYSIDALEPVISSRTLEIHHGKHLQAYVDNLNKLIPGTEFENLGLIDIVKRSSGAIFNNAGQVLNHNLYFEQFCAPGSGEPGKDNALVARIVEQWGSLDAFKEEFAAKGVSLFGSGWVWLSADKDGSLVITQEAGASNPVVKGLKPVLTFDVWEHAYYLDYQNRRPAHLAALWGILDWKVLEARYQA